MKEEISPKALKYVKTLVLQELGQTNNNLSHENHPNAHRTDSESPDAQSEDGENHEDECPSKQLGDPEYNTDDDTDLEMDYDGKACCVIM